MCRFIPLLFHKSNVSMSIFCKNFFLSLLGQCKRGKTFFRARLGLLLQRPSSGRWKKELPHARSITQRWELATGQLEAMPRRRPNLARRGGE